MYLPTDVNSATSQNALVVEVLVVYLCVCVSIYVNMHICIFSPIGARCSVNVLSHLYNQGSSLRQCFSSLVPAWIILCQEEGAVLCILGYFTASQASTH